MEEDIKIMMATRGWQYVQKFFEEECDSGIKGIKTDQLPEIIATQYIGQVEAKKIIRRVLNRVKKLGIDKQFNEISYK